MKTIVLLIYEEQYELAVLSFLFLSSHLELVFVYSAL